MFLVPRLQKLACPLSSGRWLSSLLEVRPPSSLLDSQVVVAGSGLEPGAVVRLETSLVDPSQHWNFQSVCRYQTDQSGVFSTDAQPTLPGSHYQGIFFQIILKKPKPPPKLPPIE